MLETRIVASMALFRFLAGTIEVSAAMLMLRFGRVDTACRINAILGLIGPAILMIVSGLGIAGLAGQIPMPRILIVGVGVALIFLGLSGM